jgi:hypothetical protein
MGYSTEKSLDWFVVGYNRRGGFVSSVFDWTRS